MRMDEAFRKMEKMFKRNFPSQTKGKDSAAVRKIMREMGYGFGTGLNKENLLKASRAGKVALQCDTCVFS